MTNQKPDSPIARLRTLVELIEKCEGEGDGTKARKVWRRYLAHIAADAEALDRDPASAPLVMRLREAGKGWPTRARELQQAIRRARKARAAHLRVVAPDERDDGHKPEPKVVGQLRKTKGDQPKILKSLLNIVTILEEDTRQAGRIRLNEFTMTVEIDGEPMTDVGTTRITVWLDDVYRLDTSSGKVDEAIRMVADNHAYHPVREYLSGLRWDGKDRCDAFVQHCLGVKPRNEEHERLIQSISRRFLISCVARTMRPGCKVDTVLVLHGEQGARKGSAIRALASDAWFSDSDFDPHGTEAYIQIQGVWLYEAGEIEKWNNRRDQATIKSFLSSQEDRYRPKFGRNTVRKPRQVVFVGTTNSGRFLEDVSGSRRYWPVTVGIVDLDTIRRDRDQIWAEALHHFRAGDAWHLTDAEADALAEHSEDYTSTHPWTEIVAEWASNALVERDHFTTAQALAGIKIEVRNWSKNAGNIVGSILRSLGYESSRVRMNGRKVSIWMLPEGQRGD